MKTRTGLAGCFALLLLLVAGCNWVQLFAFRAQMRSIAEFTRWEGPEASVFRFTKPILTLQDLLELGIYVDLVSDQEARVRYRRRSAPYSVEADYDFRLLIENGRLSGVVFPASLREGLGRRNISGLFAMIGGVDADGAGIDALPKDQLIAAGLFSGKAPDLGREVTVDLIPVDSRNRPVRLTMFEHKKAGYYTEFHLDVRRPTKN